MRRRSAFVLLALLSLTAGLLLTWPEHQSVSAQGVSTLDGGAMHSCAQLTNGQLRCWGGNAFGQLGTGTNSGGYIAQEVVGLEAGVIDVAAGFWHTCVVTASGAVKCWGANGFGELGSDGPRTNVPIAVPGLTAGAVAVAAGHHHTCVLLTAGSVKCWGWYYDNGPVDIAGLPGPVLDIAAGRNRTCALLADNRVACWNSEDQQAEVVATLVGAPITIDVGGHSECAVTAAHALYCWNGFSTTIPSSVDDVSSGEEHTCVVLSDGAVECWGTNRYGQLGNGTTVDSDAPVSVGGLDGAAVAVAAGDYHSCALLASGNVQCWGWSHVGQLGNGTLGYSMTPVTVLNLKPGSCPPSGCEPPPPPALPLPDCPSLPPSSGAAGMALNAPAMVMEGDVFALCVEASPPPDVPIAGYQTEVDLAPEIVWLPRPACASIVPGNGEAQATTAGGLPNECLRATGPTGQPRHVAGNGPAAPPLPPLDSPLGRLLELDLTCAEAGTYALTLTGDGGWSAVYFQTNTVPLFLPTIPYQGRQVADIHIVRCIDPSSTEDSDGDGCLDVYELALPPEDGGYRDPNNFWDFYDTPTGMGMSRDDAVSGLDFFAVLRRFNAQGDPEIDPLSTPPANGYHTSYDRGGMAGPNPWNLAAADGAIGGADVFAVLGQFNHVCS